MRALVTGATGFIGRRLLKDLDHPVVLTRNPVRAQAALEGVEAFAWDPIPGPPPVTAFDGVEAVIHLAGDPVAARWSEERKKMIRDSRVTGTRNLVSAIEMLPERPRMLVSASAVGYYGDRGDEILDETSPPGIGWLSEVCATWETEALRAAGLGVRVACLRFGIVLGRGGGALARMLPPFRLGLGGRIGSGRQWMSWIHVDDVAGLILHAASGASLAGPVNAVAPSPVTNADFTLALGAALRRPTIFPVPAAALRLIFGEMSEVMLSSQRALPRAAMAGGYAFRHPEIGDALRASV